MNFIKRYFQLRKHNIKKRINNVWWNQSAHMRDVRFPIIKWEKIGYLDCVKGLIVPMQELPDGRFAYYEVVKVWRQRGSDWLYDSDAVNCDMVFHGIRSELGVGGLPEKKEEIRFIQFNP